MQTTNERYRIVGECISGLQYAYLTRRNVRMKALKWRECFIVRLSEIVSEGSFIVMRRKIKHLKRYKSYPKNVPRKLLKLFFDFNCSVSKLASSRGVNTGTLSALLNDGHEPKDSNARLKLFLSANPICKLCHRKVIRHSSKPKQSKPDFIIQWEHLPREERHKVIQEYLKWKMNNQNK